MKPSGRVVTCDYPPRMGTITEASEECLGTQSCYVVLDSGAGEGSYRASNLQPLDVDDLEAHLGAGVFGAISSLER